MRGRPQPGPLNMLGPLEVSPSGVRIQRCARSHTQYQRATGFHKRKGSGGQSVCTPESRWGDSPNTHAQATPNLINQNLCVGDHMHFGVSPQVILMHEEQTSSHPPTSQGKIYRSWYGLNRLPRKVLKYQPSVPVRVTLLGDRVFVDNQGKTRSLGWAPFQYELVCLQKGEIWTETHRKGECGFKRKTDIRMMYLQAEEHQGYV